MKSMILILFSILSILLHHRFLSIWQIRKEGKIDQIRFIFAVLTAVLWAIEIIYSSFPMTFYDFLYTSRCLLRLSRVYIYVLLLLTDYRKLFRFLTRYRECLFILCPVFSYIILETAIGTNPLKISFSCILFTLLYLLLIYLLLFLLTGKADFSFISVSLLMLALGIGNYFVFQFRERYITYSDIYELTAAAAVAGKYEYTLSRSCYNAIVFFLALMIIIFMTRKETLKKYLPKPGVRIPLCLLIVIFLIFSVKSDLFLGKDTKNKAWSVIASERAYGYLVSALTEIHNSQSAKPKNYSP